MLLQFESKGASRLLISARRVAVVILFALVGRLAALEAQDVPDPEVEAGIRQVQEGDFEAAVVTLDAASRRLARDAPRSPHRLPAFLNLAVACVALDRRDLARARFKDALALDPGLRLATDRYSPKVVAVFEEARREREAEARAAASTRTGPATRKGSRVPWILGGAGAVGGGVFLATRGGGNGGTAAFSGARFATTVLDCPDGQVDAPLAVGILVDARNGAKTSATITGVTATLVIVTSAIPGEIGFASSQTATALPASVPAGRSATVRVDTTLLCRNGAGDASRFNEWAGRVTLSTDAGIFNLETADRMRVNIP